MHILCPHCRNPIEVVKLTPREEVSCPSCGSSFCLETDSTTGWQRAGEKLGKFEVIETVGHYNAQTSPSTIVLDEERIRDWLARGAQPSNTVRKLLRTQGIE